MVAMGRKSVAVLTVAVVVAALGGCSRELRRQVAQPPTTTQTTPAADFAATLQKRVTADAMMAHLKKLQEIADAHDGNRALGTPGYDASVDYVANTLRDKGFDVQTPEFEVRLPFAEEPSLTVGGNKVAAKPLEFTIGTPPEGVSGPLVPARVEDTPGLHGIRLRRPAGRRVRWCWWTAASASSASSRPSPPNAARWR